MVAIAKAASHAYADPADASGKLSVVDVVPDKRLKRPVTLAEIKADKSFASFPLVRMSRLSVMPVTDARVGTDRSPQSLVRSGRTHPAHRRLQPRGWWPRWHRHRTRPRRPTCSSPANWPNPKA